MPVVSEDQNWTTSVTGTSPDYFEIRNWPIASGAAFTQQDVDGGDEGRRARRRRSSRSSTAPNADPIGQTVRIGNMPFEVVGVAGEEGAVGERAGLRRRGVHPVHDVRAARSRAASASTSRARSWSTATSSRRHRRARRRTSPRSCATATTSRAGDDDDFSIRNLSEIAGAQAGGDARR